MGLYMSNEIDEISKSVQDFNLKYNTASLSKDTMGAIISIEQNKQFIKTKFYNIGITHKHECALEFIKDNFPRCDLNVVSGKLIRIGYYPIWLIRLFSISISTFITSFIIYLMFLNIDDPIGASILAIIPLMLYGISIAFIFGEIRHRRRY